MVSFKEAIEVATSNAKSLIEKSKNIVLEGVLISDDKKLYEVSLSYDLIGEDPLGAQQNNDSLSQLAKVMGYRRQYKTFLIDCGKGDFRGFKNEK